MMKIDCNVTENYFKEKYRMTANCCLCEECPLGASNNRKGCGCKYFEFGFPAEAVANVQKWSDEHPRKTYLEDFHEKYPKAEMSNDGTPAPCRSYLYATPEGECEHDCKKCWDEVMAE